MSRAVVTQGPRMWVTDHKVGVLSLHCWTVERGHCSSLLQGHRTVADPALWPWLPTNKDMWRNEFHCAAKCMWQLKAISSSRSIVEESFGLRSIRQGWKCMENFLLIMQFETQHKRGQLASTSLVSESLNHPWIILHIPGSGQRTDRQHNASVICNH